MIKIVSDTLEEAYRDATSKLECSVTELNIEVVQSPSKGFLGLFKKSAIIVVAKKNDTIPVVETKVSSDSSSESAQSTDVNREDKKEYIKEDKKQDNSKPRKKYQKTPDKKELHVINDTIMPESFVSTQDDEDYDMADINFTADYDEDESDIESIVDTTNTQEIATKIETEINQLFDLTCFDIDKIEVSVYDENTLLIEFKGDDAALLIGKEGYRYKALSYMIFNWINTKYKLQLRLEIAEFLKNQEESVNRYLVGVCENIDKDGRAQTKILDGVLVQIALRELRDKYPDKYVAIRSTRDGLKFIIINDYHSN